MDDADGKTHSLFRRMAERLAERKDDMFSKVRMRDGHGRDLCTPRTATPMPCYVRCGRW